jgi:hypothetical protein
MMYLYQKVIEKACSNARQCVIALAGGELIYFKLDDESSMLQVYIYLMHMLF